VTVADELVAAANFRVAMRGTRDPQEFSLRLVKSLNEVLTNRSWNTLSKDAQKWFNRAIDNINNGREIENPLSPSNLSAVPNAPKSRHGLGASRRRALWNYDSRRTQVIRYLVEDQFSSLDPADIVRGMAEKGVPIATETVHNVITSTLAVIGELMKHGWFERDFDFEAMKRRIEDSNSRLN